MRCLHKYLVKWPISILPILLSISLNPFDFCDMTLLLLILLLTLSFFVILLSTIWSIILRSSSTDLSSWICNYRFITKIFSTWPSPNDTHLHLYHLSISNFIAGNKGKAPNGYYNVIIHYSYFHNCFPISSYYVRTFCSLVSRSLVTWRRQVDSCRPL